MEELEAELLTVHPGASHGRLGKHQLWRFQVKTPAHTFESIVKRLDERCLVELTARDSFDESLAVAILDRLEGQQLPTHASNKLRIVPVHFPKPWQFDCLVIVPPRVAGRFGHQSKRLRLATYWAIPAFQGEFEDGASGKEFWHQLYRKDGWRVVAVRWDRSRKTEPAFDT
jgi:hypothetical protein